MSRPTSTPIPEHANTAGTYHIFMTLKTTRHWLDLPNSKRHEFFEAFFFPVLKQRPQVTLKIYEPEAFNADVSDIYVWKTDDLTAWFWIADHLRETQFWDHYFRVVSILPAVKADYTSTFDGSEQERASTTSAAR